MQNAFATALVLTDARKERYPMIGGKIQIPLKAAKNYESGRAENKWGASALVNTYAA